MKNPSLLPLVPLLLAIAVSASLPATAARRGVWVIPEELLPLNATRAEQPSSRVQCVGDGVYAANSTYQANLRRVAALLLADASTNGGSYYTSHTLGYWPNRLEASLFCRRHGDDGAGHSCAACITRAFLEVERACPYHREAFFRSRNCTLQLDEFRIFGSGGIFQEINMLNQAMASGLIFQAIGFGWLFFLLLQEWRSRKRGSLL